MQSVELQTASQCFVIETSTDKHVCSSEVGKHQESSRRRHREWVQEGHVPGMIRCKRDNLINIVVQTFCNCYNNHLLNHPSVDSSSQHAGS